TEMPLALKLAVMMFLSASVAPPSVIVPPVALLMTIPAPLPATNSFPVAVKSFAPPSKSIPESLAKTVLFWAVTAPITPPANSPTPLFPAGTVLPPPHPPPAELPRPQPPIQLDPTPTGKDGIPFHPCIPPQIAHSHPRLRRQERIAADRHIGSDAIAKDRI